MAPSTIAQLPPGYEILPLEEKHIDWVAALLAHAHSFDSPLWVGVPYHMGTPAQRVYDIFRTVRPSVWACITSGLSYGVFIKQGANPPPGRLEWNLNDVYASRETLLMQMNFPLVSIALSKDAASAKAAPAEGVPPLGEILPGHSNINAGLKEGAQGKEKKAKEPGKVIQRGGTHTRGDHAGRGLAKALAHHVALMMRQLGYKAIVINTGGEAVNRVWENLPEPFHSEVLSTFNTAHYPHMYGGAWVECKRIRVTWSW